MGRKYKPRKRKRRPLTPWEHVHNELAAVLQETKWKRSSREFVGLHYFGTIQQLRKHLIKMLNLIDLEKKEQEDGLPTENRWT